MISKRVTGKSNVKKAIFEAISAFTAIGFLFGFLHKITVTAFL